MFFKTPYREFAAIPHVWEEPLLHKIGSDKNLKGLLL
jgi:hypothetical protein